MFQVIGERVNTSGKKVRKATAARVAGYIVDERQKAALEAGSDFIDVNAGDG